MTEDDKLSCPKCFTKFSLCKTWEKGNWVYFCFTKGCDYKKVVPPTTDEIEMFNEG